MNPSNPTPAGTTTLPTRRLGRSGLEVSRLSLGGLFVAGGTNQDSTAVVRRAYELGISYIDTAPSYGDSETALGRIFGEVGGPAVLSTKVGEQTTEFDPRDERSIRSSLDRSLERLGRDQLDMVLVHEPDRPGLYDWWEDMAAVEGPVLDVLEDYRERGLVRSIGLGGTGVTELAHLVRSGRFDVVLTAFNYSLLFREAEDSVIAAARELDVGVIAGSPLQQGAFATRFAAIDDDSVYWLHPTRRQQFKDLYALSDECGLDLPELAIRFVLSNPSVDTVLMGARTVGEVESNVGAVERGPLPQDILARIDEIAGRLPCRPMEEPAGLGARLANPGAYKGPGRVTY